MCRRIGATLGFALCIPAFPQNQAALRSLVSILKQDPAGHSETSLGFVIGPNQVATVFQAINAATKIEITFADGHKVNTRDIWACDRLKDWAIIKVDTGAIPALARATPAELESDGSKIMRVSTPQRIGGPLLSPTGHVAGIISEESITPIAVVPAITGGKSARLEVLIDSGVLDTPLNAAPFLVSAGIARTIDKSGGGFHAEDAKQFSHQDSVAWIYSLWQKKDRTGSGEAAARVYDARNRALVDLTPQTMKLREGAPSLADFRVALQKLPAGVYRVDILWNDQPVWRSTFTVSDN